jgi:RNA-directed DNA polymerase
MRKASMGLQELRRKIYSKAKTEKYWRFWGLYCHISKKEVLEEAYRLAKANGVTGVRLAYVHPDIRIGARQQN